MALHMHVVLEINALKERSLVMNQPPIELVVHGHLESS
jgi:hypothetical protein